MAGEKMDADERKNHTMLEANACFINEAKKRKKVRDKELDDGAFPKIQVGVCVMEKKAYSAPMTEILKRLQAFGEFEISIFGDKVILENPIERWPWCDCLIAFYSSGYPLEKVEAYASLRRPFLVNELESQHLLHDRRKVYVRLEEYGIPVPNYAVVNREYPYQELDYLIEEEDYIEVHGERIFKPFVEKPVDGDNHSVMIYYPSSAGGGMKELFRKIGNRSSEFHPEVRRIRRESSYLYEEFMPTGGTDVKVYTVGPEYAHAEARKSPVVDGVVLRSADGKEAKLKSAVQLQDLLDATRMLVPRARSGRESDSETEDFEHAENLRHVKAVLEEGGHFSGIYRKVQLKPQKWERVVREDHEAEEERPVEALMVLKYGGVLTHAGRKQAEELGRLFRNFMYPGEGTGLLRLHSTYRHDLKIYSSDEGRVQMSAAAFAKGLLDLEGQLTPILVSLVSKDSPMLDGLDSASIEMEAAKAKLYELITSEIQTPALPQNGDDPWMTDGCGLPPNAFELLRKLVVLTRSITAQVRALCKAEEERLSDLELELDGNIPPYDQAQALGKTNIDVDRIAAGLPCGSEGFLLMFARWKKLERDIYNERRDRYNITKVPDIYDSSKYDLLHNAHLKLDGLEELYTVAKALADGVIPNEYGINPRQKLKIGSKIARRLWGKILIDLRNTREEAIKVSELKNAQENVRASSMAKASKSVEEDIKSVPKVQSKHNISRRSSSNSEKSLDADDSDDKETQYRLDPKYANVRTPERHVRTRLYFTSESHIHSLINVLRYCHLDESLQGEPGLVSNAALLRIYETKELDYLTHVVLRMYENTAVSLDDPRRFRIELMFSSGAAVSPIEASPRYRDHTLPVFLPETLQEEGVFLSLDRLERMLQSFAMPAEDFPPASIPQNFSGFFSKGGGVLERLANLWPFNKHPHVKV